MSAYTTSELARSSIPYKGDSSNRFSYYTDIEIAIGEIRRRIKFKVDTGSPFTIVGMELLKKKGVQRDKINSIIIKQIPVPILNDASGNMVNILPCVVRDFQLTSEICFEKIKIYVSADIKSRAVLGMDILSLFGFQYKQEKGNMLGTFWINNYQEHLQKINGILKKKNLDYLDAEQIFLLEEQKENKQ